MINRLVTNLVQSGPSFPVFKAGKKVYSGAVAKRGTIHLFLWLFGGEKIGDIGFGTDSGVGVPDV